MWDIIEANKRKSLIIFFAMGGFLLILGYILGQGFWDLFISQIPMYAKTLGKKQTGEMAHQAGLIGLAVAYIIWMTWSIISYYFGDRFIMFANKVHEVDKTSHPRLYNIAEEMSIAANMETMPQLYIIYSSTPNAFAAATGSENSIIAVTTGLLDLLNRDELQGVIAHEISHIINKDALLLTFAGVMLGTGQLLADMFLNTSDYIDPPTLRHRRHSKSGFASAVAWLLSFMTPVIMSAMYFAVSRQREYLADASAARLTRHPEGLASALERISNCNINTLSASRITAAMYITNPFQDIKSWFPTHPPIETRIKVLRSMAGNASLADYQKAFKQVNPEEDLVIADTK